MAKRRSYSRLRLRSRVLHYRRRERRQRKRTGGLLGAWKRAFLHSANR